MALSYSSPHERPKKERGDKDSHRERDSLKREQIVLYMYVCVCICVCVCVCVCMCVCVCVHLYLSACANEMQSQHIVG